MVDAMPKDGYKVIGTIISLKRNAVCDQGHKVGDQFDLSDSKSAGLCTWLYSSIFPHLRMLHAGGTPLGSNGEKLEKSILMRCPDMNTDVTIELRRVN